MEAPKYILEYVSLSNAKPEASYEALEAKAAQPQANVDQENLILSGFPASPLTSHETWSDQDLETVAKKEEGVSGVCYSKVRIRNGKLHIFLTSSIRPAKARELLEERKKAAPKPVLDLDRIIALNQVNHEAKPVTVPTHEPIGEREAGSVAKKVNFREFL